MFMNCLIASYTTHTHAVTHTHTHTHTRIDMNFVIRVADFGLADSVGTKEYFRQDESTTVKLPLS